MRALTPQELRAERSRKRRPLYKLAADVGLHPGRLGMVLNEKLPLTPELAERIARALERDMSGE